MSKYNQSKVKAIFGGKGFYIALVLCLAAAAVIVYLALLHPLQTKQESPSQRWRLKRQACLSLPLPGQLRATSMSANSCSLGLTL